MKTSGTVDEYSSELPYKLARLMGEHGTGVHGLQNPGPVLCSVIDGWYLIRRGKLTRLGQDVLAILEAEKADRP